MPVHPAYRTRLVCGGQALIPALLLLSLCGVAWAALYNLGQVAAARTRPVRRVKIVTIRSASPSFWVRSTTPSSR